MKAFKAFKLIFSLRPGLTRAGLTKMSFVIVIGMTR